MCFGGTTGNYRSDHIENSATYNLKEGKITFNAPHIVGYVVKKLPEFPLYESKIKKNNIVPFPKEISYGDKRYLKHT